MISSGRRDVHRLIRRYERGVDAASRRRSFEATGEKHRNKHAPGLERGQNGAWPNMRLVTVFLSLFRF
jgi:hypothetical protein